MPDDLLRRRSVVNLDDSDRLGEDIGAWQQQREQLARWQAEHGVRFSWSELNAERRRRWPVVARSDAQQNVSAAL